jgi:hypothetical protein
MTPILIGVLETAGEAGAWLAALEDIALATGVGAIEVTGDAVLVVPLHPVATTTMAATATRTLSFLRMTRG